MKYISMLENQKLAVLLEYKKLSILISQISWLTR
jgi:hypothetical protein